MMKRLLILVTLLCLAFPALRAQGRHEFNLSLGLLSSEQVLLSGSESNYLELYELYEPHYNAEGGDVVTLDYNFKLNKVVHIGAQLDYSHVRGRSWYSIGGQQGQQFSTNIFSFLPQVKLRIPGSPHFRLYGKAAAGINILVTDLEIRKKSSPVRFAWEIVPFGFEWGGNRVYGMAEVCVGNVLLGGRLGIGFRF